jgi:hypothetical protein
MIECKRCKFEVSNGMRYSLVNNCCPSCGQALLGEAYMQRLSFLSEKIRNQDFANGLPKDIIFDMSLFILSEYFISEEPVAPVASAVPEPDPPAEATEDDVADSQESESDIRDQVRAEALDLIPELSKEEDDDLRVARLKRLANESKAVRKAGASVRRVMD